MTAIEPKVKKKLQGLWKRKKTRARKEEFITSNSLFSPLPFSLPSLSTKPLISLGFSFQLPQPVCTFRSFSAFASPADFLPAARSKQIAGSVLRAVSYVSACCANAREINAFVNCKTWQIVKTWGEQNIRKQNLEKGYLLPFSSSDVNGETSTTAPGRFFLRKLQALIAMSALLLPVYHAWETIKTFPHDVSVYQRIFHADANPASTKKFYQYP